MFFSNIEFNAEGIHTFDVQKELACKYFTCIEFCNCNMSNETINLNWITFSGFTGMKNGGYIKLSARNIEIHAQSNLLAIGEENDSCEDTGAGSGGNIVIDCNLLSLVDINDVQNVIFNCDGGKGMPVTLKNKSVFLSERLEQRRFEIEEEEDLNGVNGYSGNIIICNHMLTVDGEEYEAAEEMERILNSVSSPNICKYL